MSPSSYIRVLVASALTVGAMVAGSITGMASATPVSIDGRVDTAFAANLGTALSDTVNVIATQPDGKILVGGFFNLNGGAPAEFARLNADGTPDAAFNSNLGTGFSAGSVRAIAVESSGAILVGGLFLDFNGTVVNHLVRLNSDGTLDTAFMSNLGTGFNGGSVRGIVVQPAEAPLVGHIVLAGYFVDINGFASAGLARVDDNGVPDTLFSQTIGTGLDGFVDTVVADPSTGDLLVGGQFTHMNGIVDAGIARFSPEGDPNATFAANLGSGLVDGLNPGSVNGIVVQQSGRIVIGGFFATLDGSPAGHLARLEATGVADPSFTANLGTGFDTDVRAIAERTSDHSLIVGGTFNTLDGVAAAQIAHVSTNGVPDRVFSTNMGTGPSAPFPPAEVYGVAVQADGGSLIGGYFDHVDGQPTPYLVRLYYSDTVAPVITMTQPTGVFASTPSVPIAWTASDAGGSGLAATCVKYAFKKAAQAGSSHNASGPCTTASATTYTPLTAPRTAAYCVLHGAAALGCSSNLVPVLGDRVCFQAVAADNSGNQTSATPRCTNLPFDERSLLRSRSTDWSRTVASGWIGSTASATTIRGATLSTTSSMTVRQLGVIALSCATCGSVDVYVNNVVVKHLSLVTTGAAERKLFTFTRYTANKVGVVKIVVTSSGKQVKIDAVGIASA